MSEGENRDVRPEDAPFAPDPGTIVGGKYEITGVLGRGGMGVVTRGRQVELDRPVAIKFLRPSLARDVRPLQRFGREARAIARMRSEHVVRVYDFGEHEGVPYIVMEELTGRDLAAELQAGPLSVEFAVELMIHACEAIAEAHALGIVHRDLKPANLFVAETLGARRTLKVLDFGVSKWLGPAPEFETPFATSDRGFLGTPAYVSPEQLTNPETTDRRSDIWALGVVFHQCLSGKLPFVGDSVPRLCAEILTAKPFALDGSLGIPDGLARIVSKCLEKDPNQRFQTVIELAHALAPYGPARARSIVESLVAMAPAITPNPDAGPVAITPTPTPERPLQATTTLEFSQEGERPITGRHPDGRPKTLVSRYAPLGALAVAALVLGAAIARSGRKAEAPAVSAHSTPTEMPRMPETKPPPEAPAVNRVEPAVDAKAEVPPSATTTPAPSAASRRQSAPPRPRPAPSAAVSAVPPPSPPPQPQPSASPSGLDSLYRR